MEERIEDKIKTIFQSHQEIKLVYLFGSYVSGKTGPLSDLDIAFYADEADEKKLYDLKFVLMDNVSRALGNNKVDIVILNLVKSPELKYQIIKEGKLIYSDLDFKVRVEPRILNEYFDFRAILLKYGLTNA